MNLAAAGLLDTECNGTDAAVMREDCDETVQRSAMTFFVSQTMYFDAPERWARRPTPGPGVESARARAESQLRRKVVPGHLGLRAGAVDLCHGCRVLTQGSRRGLSRADSPEAADRDGPHCGRALATSS